MDLLNVIDESKINKIPKATLAGIDIGSRQSKAAMLHEGQLFVAIMPTGYVMQEAADELLHKLVKEAGITREDIDCIVSTGYGRVALDFGSTPSKVVTEIACHGMGAHFLGHDIHTIIDIGGQDSKAIRIDPETGKVTDFAMNDKCAAGTGRFLERIAKVLEMDTTTIGPVSLKAENPVDISAQCIVFAESEVVSDRAQGRNVADIAAGIHASVARRVYSLLNRVGIEKNVLFTGGVSNNPGIVKAFEDLLGFPVSTAKLDTVYAGALGAAVLAGQYLGERAQEQEAGSNDFSLDLSSADGYLGQAPCAKMKPLNDMVEHAVKLAQEYEAEAVVLYYLKFCPCYSMILRKVTDAFEAAGFPVLVVGSDYSKGDEGQIKIRIEAFLEMLGQNREV